MTDPDGTHRRKVVGQVRWRGAAIPILDIPDLGAALDLSYRGITDLSEVEGLADAALVSLILDHNALSCLHGLPEIPSLHYLNISHNQLSSLNELPQRLPALACLSIDHNAIRTLDPLAQLPELSWLQVSHNQIAQIAGIATLPLHSLYLASNRISVLGGLPPSLDWLDLRGNRITHLAGLNCLPKLDHLNLAFNQISRLDGEDLPPHLGIGYFTRNRIALVRAISLEIRHLDLTFNRIASLDALNGAEPLLIRGAIELYGNPVFPQLVERYPLSLQEKIFFEFGEKVFNDLIFSSDGD